MTLRNNNKLAICEAITTNNGDIQFAETVDERIDEWPHSWPEGEISYRLNNFSGDLYKRWQTRAVTVALRAWQWKLSKIKFRKERNKDVSVDFDVSFEDLSHFDDKKGVLAHAVFPGQGKASGDCHINDDWHWRPGVHNSTMGKPPLVPILIHEFGHSIGLQHDPYDTTDIMYPSFDLGKKKNTIGERSTKRAQARYGVRTLKPWQMAYWINRRNNGADFR